MCYAKPGLRCSTHTTARLIKTKSAYDRQPAPEREAALDEARDDFLNSPRGIKALRTGYMVLPRAQDKEEDEEEDYLPAENFGITVDQEEADRREEGRKEALRQMREQEGTTQPRPRGRPANTEGQGYNSRLEASFAPSEKKELNEAAKQEGVSVSELVRTRLAVEEDTGEYKDLGERVLAVIDRNRTGRSDRWGNYPDATKELMKRNLIEGRISDRTGRNPTYSEEDRRVTTKPNAKGESRNASNARVKASVSDEAAVEVSKRAEALGITKSDYLRRKVVYGQAGFLEPHMGSAAMRHHAVSMRNVGQYGWDWRDRDDAEDLEEGN